MHDVMRIRKMVNTKVMELRPYGLGYWNEQESIERY